MVFYNLFFFCEHLNLLIPAHLIKDFGYLKTPEKNDDTCPAKTVTDVRGRTAAWLHQNLTPLPVSIAAISDV